jgi:alpha-L-fucosidase 2
MRRIWPVTIALVAFAAPLNGGPSPTVEILRDLVYASPAGVALRLDAYLQRGPGPHPAVIYVHGGGWTRGSKARGAESFLMPHTADAGYAIFSIEYRLAPEHPYPAAPDDVRTAIRFVQANGARFRVDAMRLAIAGASAGGHLVSLVGVTPCDGPAGRGSAGCGVRATINFFGPADLREWRDVPPIRAFLGPRLDSADADRLLAEASPITHVSRDDPPLLILHGDRDPVVPYAQSVALERALREAGGSVRLITVPGGDHGRNWTGITSVDWRREIVRWLDRHARPVR